MLWRKQSRVEVPDDLDQARNIKREAAKDMSQLKRQAPYVSRLAARLIERRELNHFGDDVQITFTPRESNA